MLPSASGAASRASPSRSIVIAHQRGGTSADVSRPNRSRMQRERTVGSSAPGTAVVRMKIVPGGGSSSDFSSEFCDCGSSVSASRISTTRRLPSNGRNDGLLEHVADRRRS